MKKKVLIAINALNIGGAPYVVREHARFLISRGYEVHILTLFRNKKVGIREEITTLIGESSLHEFRLDKEGFFNVRVYMQLFSLFKKESFDVVFTHLFVPNTIVRLIAYLGGTPCIFSYEHSMYDDKKRWQKMVDRVLASITSRILVSNVATAEFTSEQEGISIEKFVVVPTPISIPLVSEKRKSEMLYSLPLIKNRQCFVTIGRFSEEKGHELILESLLQIDKEERPYCLFVGYGPLESYLKEEIEKKGLGQDVVVITDPHNAKEYFSIAHAFLLASRREGQALVVCEALAFGIPVIAPDIPSVMEYVEDGVNGFIFRKEDVSSLTNAFKRAQSSGGFEIMGRESRKTFDRIMRDYNLDILEELIKSCE